MSGINSMPDLLGSGSFLRLWVKAADVFFATGIEFFKCVGNLHSSLLEGVYSSIRLFTPDTVKPGFIKSSPLQKTLQEQCVFSKKLYAHPNLLSISLYLII